MVFNHLEEITHQFITYASLRIDKKIFASIIHVGAIILSTKPCNYFFVIMKKLFGTTQSALLMVILVAILERSSFSLFCKSIPSSQM